MRATAYDNPYPAPSVLGLCTASGAEYNPTRQQVIDGSDIFPVSPLQRISAAVPRLGFNVNLSAGLAANLRAGGPTL